MLRCVLCEHLLHKIYCLQRQICFTNSTFYIVTLEEVVETDAYIFVLDFSPLSGETLVSQDGRDFIGQILIPKKLPVAPFIFIKIYGG